MGMFAALPRLCGYPDAEILHESCQCKGDSFCQAIMRWELVDSDAAKTAQAELQARLSQARLEELHHTVAELVSGDSLENVLTKVMAAAGRAVPASSYILAVKTSASADRWLCTEGIDALAAGRIVDGLNGGSGGQTATHMCVVEVDVGPEPLRTPRRRPLGVRFVRTARTFDPRVLRPLGGERTRFGGLHRRSPPTGDDGSGPTRLVELVGRRGLDRRDAPSPRPCRALHCRL